MTDLKITGLGAGQDISKLKPAGKEPAVGFDAMMQDAMGKISQVQTDTEKAVKELTSGGDPTQAIIAMEKADMDFQLMLEVRNKLLSAYQEVMRMQV